MGDPRVREQDAKGENGQWTIYPLGEYCLLEKRLRIWRTEHGKGSAAGNPEMDLEYPKPTAAGYDESAQS